MSAVLRPRDLDEAVAMLKERGPGATVVAGEAGGRDPVLSVDGLREGAALDYNPMWGLRLGAGLDAGRVRRHEVVAGRYGAIADVLGLIEAGATVRADLAEWGARLCAASLVAHSGSFRSLTPHGVREGLVEERFHAKERPFGKNEVLVDLFLPKTYPRTGSATVAEAAGALVLASVLVTLEPDMEVMRDVRVCCGGAGVMPSRSKKAEAALEGEEPVPAVFERGAAAAAAAAGAARETWQRLVGAALQTAVERARATPA